MRNIAWGLSIASLMIACTSHTVSSENFTAIGLDNGKIMRVEKTNNTTIQKGMLTGHVYGETLSYRYKITVNKNEVIWDGGSSVPQQILFSNQGVCIHFFREDSHQRELASQDGKAHYEIIKTVVPVYERFVDERYFFKLFGEYHWIEISPETYQKMKESGAYFPIPNGNELTRPSPQRAKPEQAQLTAS
jgi:hypothetical protein